MPAVQPFRPAWWLPSPHLQTIWPEFFRKRPSLSLIMERVELADGDFIDLAWHPRPGAPCVLIVHGLEGSLRSHYAQTTMHALHQAGFASVFMHLRGRSGEPNRHASSYHSGRTEDLAEVLAYLASQGRSPAAAMGISLGGNLLLKFLGEAGAAAGLKTAIAISVPFRLDECAQKLDRGPTRLYGYHLLRRLKASYRSKFSTMPSPLTVDVAGLTSLESFDNAVTAPLHGFANAHDYYARCSSRQFLRDIAIPTLIVHALDDPFMYPSTPPTPAELSPTVTLELTKHGGHVGFVSGSAPWAATYWLEGRIVGWLQHTLPQFSP